MSGIVGNLFSAGRFVGNAQITCQPNQQRCSKTSLILSTVYYPYWMTMMSVPMDGTPGSHPFDNMTAKGRLALAQNSSCQR